MKEYFASAEHQEAARIVVNGWLGSPYEHMGRSKRGVDCVGFVGLLLVEIGILDHLDGFDAFYPHDWHAAKQDLMCQTIERHLATCLAAGVTGQIVDGSPKLGDLVCLKSNAAVVNHTVFMLSASRFAHAIQSAGVALDDLLRWKKNVVKIYRFYEA